MNEVSAAAIVLLILSSIKYSTQECQDDGDHCHLVEVLRTQMNQLKQKLAELSFPRSCKEVKISQPDWFSGYYNILVDGVNQTVYCNMDELCGQNGGWMRVGHLNMSDPSEQCPPGFRLYEVNETRACGRQDNFEGCISVNLTTYGVHYTQVCGRVTGYQKGSPDAIDQRSGQRNDINQAYVDGVSITRGNPRQHVWTFMASLQENSFADKGDSECPCAPNNTAVTTTQSFIGNDYFCESGTGSFDKTTLHTNDPLWDGKQCGLVEGPCCNVTGIPWFNKELPQPTTDYIELRVCIDDNISDEDVPVGYYEIYVQ